MLFYLMMQQRMQKNVFFKRRPYEKVADCRYY